MNKEETTIIIEYLKKLSIGKEIKYLDFGLCSNLEFFCLDQGILPEPYLDILRSNVTNWDYYTGILVYPVPSPNKRIDAFGYYRSCSNKWIGRYGKKRKQLCAWFAEILQNELNNQI